MCIPHATTSNQFEVVAFMNLVKPCSHSVWLDKSCMRFDKSCTVGTQKFVVTRAGLTRLDQARPFPQFVGKITKHQRLCGLMDDKYGLSCVPTTCGLFSVFPSMYFLFHSFFFYIPFLTLIYSNNFFTGIFFQSFFFN